FAPVLSATFSRDSCWITCFSLSTWFSRRARALVNSLLVLAPASPGEVVSVSRVRESLLDLSRHSTDREADRLATKVDLETDPSIRTEPRWKDYLAFSRISTTR